MTVFEQKLANARANLNNAIPIPWELIVMGIKAIGLAIDAAIEKRKDLKGRVGVLEAALVTLSRVTQHEIEELKAEIGKLKAGK